MIQNYFKIAWRNLIKYKAFSFINIFILVIAAPLAILFNNYWLNFMVVREELSAGTIALGSGILLLLGLASIMPQTFKIAKSNPVESLKTE